MQEPTTATVSFPSDETRDVLSEILRDGAQRMLATAVEAEVGEWIDQHAHIKDENGRRQVVRNGYLPKRKITTGVGQVEVRQPRVHDRRPENQKERFSSKILPPYLRKTRSIEELIPWLYLKGVSTGEFPEALQALLGPDAAGLSATTVTRLKGHWEQEQEEWSKRSLVGKKYVYVWADGIHFNIRLEEDRQCILVLMGATPDGKKELIAIHDGHRESEQSWKELLLDCKARGLTVDPKLATGDGALGFWKALAQVFPSTREQRCTVHKTANVLDKLPKRLQPAAKAKLHDIWQAATRETLCANTPTELAGKSCECFASPRQPASVTSGRPSRNCSNMPRRTHIELTVFSSTRWTVPPETSLITLAYSRIAEQQSQLLDLRLDEEIDSETFAAKATELRDKAASMALHMEKASRGRYEIIDIAVKSFELSRATQQMVYG